MTMSMLAAGGVDLLTDGVRTADDSNPNGYHEFEEVKELDTTRAASWLDDARGKAVKIISHLLQALPQTLNYKVIFMRRALHEVIASQNAMLQRRGEPSGDDDDGVRVAFEAHLAQVSRLMTTRSCFDFIEINYADVVADPLRGARRLNDFLGGWLDVERMVAAVDPRLYRNREVGEHYE